MPNPQDPNQAWSKAATIGASQVGERYAEPTNPGVLDLVRQIMGMGPARPPSVAAQDPYGIEAWMKGAGPMPVMAASTHDVGIKGYHASPQNFTQFDNSKIGTGVGAQMYSHGHYQAGNLPIGEHYVDLLGVPTLQVGNKVFKTPEAAADRLSADPNNKDIWQGTFDAVEHILKGKKINEGLEDYWTFPQPVRNQQDLLAQAAADPQGYASGWAQIMKILQKGSGRVAQIKPHLYQTRFNADPATLLNWDKTFPEQTPQVQGALSDMVPKDWQGPNSPALGEHVYRNLTERAGSPAQASQALLQKGVPGVTYKDYELGHNANNHVAFDGSWLDIIKKLYGVAGAAGLAQFLAKQSAPEPEQ